MSLNKKQKVACGIVAVGGLALAVEIAFTVTTGERGPLKAGFDAFRGEVGEAIDNSELGKGLGGLEFRGP